jgi:electron transfer flavoprotein alpha subunit
MLLGLVEYERGALTGLSLEMLTFARRLAGPLNAPLEAVLIGAEARPLAEGLRAHGVSTVHLVVHDRLDAYAPEAWAQSVVELVNALKPQAVLAAGSERGNEVLAHVAARADLPLAANCIDVQPGDPFVVVRQRWGGSLLEEARLKGAVKLLTVAPNVIAAKATPSAEFALREVTPALTDKEFRVRVVERVASGAGKISLGEARLVVGGGRGVGSAEGFKLLEELAGLLGGAVGCSRAVTSLGWRPHMDQIGQTGTRITAELYIACGVSGATQHIVGCKGAKHILAVNTDPDAPIVAHADYAIIGDLHQIVPALSAEIKMARGG